MRQRCLPPSSSSVRSLGLQLVAEGVENFAQAEFLRTLECERVQGFHFYQPVSAEEVVGFGCLRAVFPAAGLIRLDHGLPWPTISSLSTWSSS